MSKKPPPIKPPRASGYQTAGSSRSPGRICYCRIGLVGRGKAQWSSYISSNTIFRVPWLRTTRRRPASKLSQPKYMRKSLDFVRTGSGRPRHPNKTNIQFHRSKRYCMMIPQSCVKPQSPTTLGKAHSGDRCRWYRERSLP